MLDGCVFSTSALLVLADFIEQAQMRRLEQQLAAERTAAAYGDEARPDMAIINPVGAGIDK
jgi:hypothetical protein